jgi:hypothetical protein
LTQRKVACVESAAGAGFNSHGRQAVDESVGLFEARRAGIAKVKL